VGGTNQLGTQYTGYIWRVDITGTYAYPGSPYTDFFTEFYPHTTVGTPVWTTNAAAGPQGYMTDVYGADYYVNYGRLSNVPYTFCAGTSGGADGVGQAGLCDSTQGSLNNGFAMGLGTLSSYSNGYAYSAILGAQVIVNDQAPPQNVQVTGAPSGWVRSGPSNLTVSATQPGLGLGSFNVTEGSYPLSSQTVPCPNAFQTDTQSPSVTLASVNYQSANTCPESASSQAFDLSGLSEGVHSIAGHAQSILGYDTGSAPAQIKIDRTPPTIVSSGPAYAAKDQPNVAGVQALHVTATDAGAAGQTTSGVVSLQTYLDGAPVAAGPNATQPCPSGSCSLSADGQIDFGTLTSGAHTVEVRATDGAGNVSVEDWLVLGGPLPPGLAAGVTRTIDSCWQGVPAPTMAAPTVYEIGSVFNSLSLTDVSELCNPDPRAVAAAGGDDTNVPNTVPFLSMTFGTCQSDSTEGSGCGPPLAVQVWPECSRNLSSYQVPSSTTTDGADEPMLSTPVQMDQLVGSLLPQVLTALPQEAGQLPSVLSTALASQLASLPAASFEDGTRIELYTGDTTIVIFGACAVSGGRLRAERG